MYGTDYDRVTSPIPDPGAVCPFGYQSKLASACFSLGSPVFLLHLKLDFFSISVYWEGLREISFHFISFNTFVFNILLLSIYVGYFTINVFQMKTRLLIAITLTSAKVASGFPSFPATCSPSHLRNLFPGCKPKRFINMGSPAFPKDASVTVDGICKGLKK